MSRRISRAARALPLVLGCLLAAWLPTSLFVRAFAVFPHNSGGAVVISDGGTVLVMLDRTSGNWAGLDARAGFRARDDVAIFGRVGPQWPSVAAGNPTSVNIPLWLIVALCFTWPFAEFVSRWRDHRAVVPIEPPDTAMTATPAAAEPVRAAA